MARILIVEDERVVAWDIHESLHVIGHEVIGNVATAQKALQMSMQARPDVVLMDIRIKGSKDGIAAASDIQTQCQIPVIFLTAHADDVTLQRAVAANPYGYILKPFNRPQLYAAIATALSRHAKEQEIEASRQRYVATLESLGDGAIAVDQSGRITFMNPVAEKVIGWSQSEILGQAVDEILQFVHADTGQPILNPLIQALQQRQSLRLPDGIALKDRQGHCRLVGDSAAPIFNTRGDLVGSVMVFQDLSDRQSQNHHHQTHQLEQRIREQNAQLQQSLNFEATLKRITDQVRDSLDEDFILETAVEELAIVLQLKGCNASLYDLEQNTSTVKYEFTTYSVPLRGRVIQHQRFQTAYEQLRQGEYFQFCSLLPHPTRDRVALLACPIIVDQEILGDLWLIHEAKHAFSEAEIRLVQQVANQCAIALRQAKLYASSQAQVNELAKLNRLKDEFLSTVSHELRTPVANMDMATQMLEIQLRQMGVVGQQLDTISRYLQILREEGQREIKLINDLLDLSLLDSVTDPLMPTFIELQVWLPPLVNAYRDRMQSASQELHLTLPDAPVILCTDMLYLERIMTQLIDNACKYTPAYEKILITMSTDEQMVHFQVTNTGVEISPQECDRIFDKFYRIPHKDPWQHSGTGLGLALAKKLAVHIGGQLTVASGDRQTTFTLSVPK